MTFDETRRHLPTPVVCLPIHERLRFVLVRPHYPENVGAAARAIKTMGFTALTLVKPGRLAAPSSEMAQKMAVRSWDVLDGAPIVTTITEALEGVDHCYATTARRGVSGVLTSRRFALDAIGRAGEGQSLAVLLGNEKTGLSAAEVAAASSCVRIPMAGDQPSINLAQAAQVLAYELFVTALEARERA